MHEASAGGGVASRIRQLLLAVLAIGMIGTASDLLLIQHHKDAWQTTPLVLLALGLTLVVWLLVRSARAGWVAVLMLRVTMVLFLGAGMLGVLLHYNGNRESQHEIEPGLSGWALFVKVTTAKAPPALAPGVMVQLGLLGLVYTFKHPALAAAHPPLDASPENNS